jgi:hypothetical protein
MGGGVLLHVVAACLSVFKCRPKCLPKSQRHASDMPATCQRHGGQGRARTGGARHGGLCATQAGAALTRASEANGSTAPRLVVGTTAVGSNELPGPLALMPPALREPVQLEPMDAADGGAGVGNAGRVEVVGGAEPLAGRCISS